MSDFVLQPGFSVDVPDMLDYFGLWQIQPDSFRPLVNKWNGVNINAHIVSQSAQEAIKQQSEKSYYVTSEKVAIFQVQGPMMKRTSSMSGGTSTLRLRQQIRQALKDNDVVAGLMQMDTPGGTVKGNSDLADEVARFVSEKPLFAFVDDLTASAGVSVASQATRIYANNANAMYGSMGTYATLVDQSRMAENLGLKVLVVNAGDFKGMGEPGSPITKEQLAEAQRIVTQLNEQYLETIARGRNRSVESIRELADGRVIFAADAVAAGLIDGIATFSEAMDQLTSMIPKGNTRTPRAAKSAAWDELQSSDELVVAASGSGEELSSSITFSTQSISLSECTSQVPDTSSAPIKPKEVSVMEPATLQELESKFPKADASWILGQLKAGATLVDAAGSYADHVQAKADADAKAHKEELARIEAENAKKIEEATAKTAQSTGSLGAQALTMSSTGEALETGDPIEDFNTAVMQHMTTYRCDRLTATTAVRKQQPKLLQAYLLACNPSKHATRVLEERFDALKV